MYDDLDFDFEIDGLDAADMKLLDEVLIPVDSSEEDEAELRKIDAELSADNIDEVAEEEIPTAVISETQIQELLDTQDAILDETEEASIEDSNEDHSEWLSEEEQKKEKTQLSFSF